MVSPAWWHKLTDPKAHAVDGLRRSCIGAMLLFLMGDLGVRLCDGLAGKVAAAEVEVCSVEPRSKEEVLNLYDPSAGVVIRPLPRGVTADPATTAEIEQAVTELEACLNSGDALRFYALHTDDWLKRSLGGIEEILAMPEITPTPLPRGHGAKYLGPWHVQLLEDGRVLVAVLLRSDDELRPDPGRTKVLIFAHHRGRWLVDEEIEKVQVPQCGLPVEVAVIVGPPPGASLTPWPSSCSA